MKKRPLCFLCICIICVLWICRSTGLFAEKEEDRHILQEYLDDHTVDVRGQIYKCEYKDGNTILFLKQAVLSVYSNHQTENIKLKNVKITCEQDQEPQPESTGQNWEAMAGDKVCAQGLLTCVKNATNPGQFDPAGYYGSEKVEYTMWDPNVSLLYRPDFSLRRSLYQMRRKIAEALQKLYPQKESGVLAAVVLGDKSNLAEEVRTRFQMAGISHVLAISGLHLSVLGMGLYKRLRRMGVPGAVGGIGVSVFLCFYSLMTGAGVGTLRSLLVFIILSGSKMAGRTYDGPTALAVTALALLSDNPDYLGYSGFWLSFSAVAAFHLFHGRNAMASGVLLYFFMAPVVLLYFYELPVYSIILNLLVVPTMGVLLMSGFAGCMLVLVNVKAAAIVLWPGIKLIEIYEYICALITRLPKATWILGRPGIIQIILFYAVMGVTLYLYRKNRIWKRRFLFLLLMIPSWVILTFHKGGKLTVTMLDVGQGDALVVHTPEDHYYLVDGGSSSAEQVGKYRILPYLKYCGAGELEAVFLSHPDEDHMNGILELLEMVRDKETVLKIHQLVLPDWETRGLFEDMIHVAGQAGIPVTYMGKGDMVMDGETTLECKYPDGGNYDTAAPIPQVLHAVHRRFGGRGGRRTRRE